MDLQSTFDYLMQIRKKEYAIKRKQLRCEELRSCLGARAIQYARGRVPMAQAAEIINYSARRTYYFRKQGVIHLGEALGGN